MNKNMADKNFEKSGTGDDSRKAPVTPNPDRNNSGLTDQTKKLSLYYRDSSSSDFSKIDRKPYPDIPFKTHLETAEKIASAGSNRLLGNPSSLRVTKIEPTFPCDSDCFLFEPVGNGAILNRKFFKRLKWRAHNVSKGKANLRDKELCFGLEALLLNLFSRLREFGSNMKNTEKRFSVQTPNYDIPKNSGNDVPMGSCRNNFLEGVYKDKENLVIAMGFVNNVVAGDASFVSVGEDIQAINEIYSMAAKKLHPQNKSELKRICHSKLEDILISVANANSELRMMLTHIFGLKEDKIKRDYDLEILHLCNKIKSMMVIDDTKRVKFDTLEQLESIASHLKLKGDSQWIKSVYLLQKKKMCKRKTDAKHFVFGTRDLYLHDVGIFDEDKRIIPYILDFDKFGKEAAMLDFGRIFLDWRIDLEFPERLKMLKKTVDYELRFKGELVKGYSGDMLERYIQKYLTEYLKDFLWLGIDIIQHSFAINYDAKRNRPAHYENFTRITNKRYCGQLVKRNGFVDTIIERFKMTSEDLVNKRIYINPAQTSEALEKSLRPLFAELLETIVRGKIDDDDVFDETERKNAHKIFEMYSKQRLI